MAIPDVALPVAARRRVVHAIGKIAGKSADRRSEGRRPFFGPVTISYDCAPQLQLSAFARDVSSLGIGLAHTMPLQRGEAIVKVPMPRGGFVSFRTQIVWCKAVGDGWYASGARLLDVVEMPV
jgi:hypothetical protein